MQKGWNLSNPRAVLPNTFPSIWKEGCWVKPTFAILANCPKRGKLFWIAKPDLKFFFILLLSSWNPITRVTIPIENNYIPDNRRGLIFQFPLCGQDGLAKSTWTEMKHKCLSPCGPRFVMCLRRYNTKCALQCPLVICVLACLLCVSQSNAERTDVNVFAYALF